MAFGVYVHWPFCAAKCPYCDFNSHVRTAIDEDGWVDGILAELDWVAEKQASRPVVETIFFGGGTPSLMRGKSAGRILQKIASLWPMANDPEITLEANPASADAARFDDYRAAGINRVSLGVQALNDADLKKLGRLHDVAEARAALNMAMGVFARVSLDLIYARPDQADADWRAELKEALSFGTEHLSLYQLTIEPETPYALLHRNGQLHIPDDDIAAGLYETTQELTAAAGVPAYEISNHARPGAESRHNLIYWRYGDYAGVGPGAHGRLNLGSHRTATAAIKLPERWRDMVGKNGHGLAERTAISNDEAAREHLLMNLRLAEGIDLAAYEKRWSTRPEAMKIAAMQEQGFVTLENDRLTATPRGRLLLNRVIDKLLN
ncbi:coproporphyrinogen III oxidase [Rhizomicrobium sp. SCGC AG-212-E05]|nr:coproporphyrinogen III oxidase [Rhizomicrobium sp. SCGC AG-212-E05]